MPNDVYSHLVSIVMPAYNSERFIADSIDSVLRQTYGKWELIVADDKSFDGTCSVVEQFTRRDPRIKLLTLHENNGPASARNAAIEAAGGRYIAFLDSDDLWPPDKLREQITFMAGTGCSLSYTSYIKIDEQGNYIGRAIEAPGRVDYEMMLLSNHIGCLTAVYDAAVLGKYYMPCVPRKEDYVLWLKILKKIKYAYGLKKCLAMHRIRRKSDSSNKIDTAIQQWKVYRDIEKISLIRSVRCYANYAYHGLVKVMR
jgi:glycosyltransferase involved in cell wall biosynthesis